MGLETECAADVIEKYAECADAEMDANRPEPKSKIDEIYEIDKWVDPQTFDTEQSYLDYVSAMGFSARASSQSSLAFHRYLRCNRVKKKWPAMRSTPTSSR